MKATIQGAIALLSALAALSASLIGPTPAHAESDAGVAPAGVLCDLGISCSEIVNDSHTLVTIARKWCWSDGTTGTATPRDPTESCSNQRNWLSAGQSTPSNQDWDTFRVDAGWCYFVAFSTGLTRYYNQAGKGAVWVKVEDTAIAQILEQRAGACP